MADAVATPRGHAGRRALITAVAVVGTLVVAVLLTFHLHRQASEEVLAQFAGDQFLVTRHLSREIAAELREHAQTLATLAAMPALRRPDPGRMAAETAELAGYLARRHVMAVAFYDENGTLVSSFPAEPDAGGGGARECLAWARKEGSRGRVHLWTTLGPPDPRGQAPLLVATLFTPVLGAAEGAEPSRAAARFAGMAALTVDLQGLVTEQLAALGMREGVRQIWIMDGDGTLLFSSAHPQEVRRSIRRRDASCAACHASFDYAERMLVDGQGVTEYQLIGRPRKVAGFAAMRFGDASWIVVVNRPYHELTGFIGASLRGHLVLLGIVFLSLTGASGFAYRSYRVSVRAEEESRRLRETRDLVARLQDSEERYRNLYDGVPVGLYQSTPKGEIVAANPALVEMLDYPCAEELRQVGAAALYVDPEERALWQAVMERDGLVREFEAQIRRADGAAIWVRDSARAVRDLAGTVLHYQGTMVDITERKRAEEALRESEERYRTIVEQSNDLVWTLDTEGKFLFFNRRAEEVTGYRLEDWRGKTFAPLLPPEDLPRIADVFAKTLAGRPQQYEVTVKRADGSTFDLAVNTAPIYVRDAVVATVSSARDITEERRAEEALRESEERYRTMVENANDFIWTLDTDGNYTFLNSRCAVPGEYAVEDLIGRSFAPLVHPDDLPGVEEAFQRTLLGEPQHYVTRAQGKEGHEYYLSINAAPIYRAGKIVGAANFGRDITEERRAGRALEESEKRYRQQAEDLSLLLEAGQLFSSSLDQERVLEEISRRCVNVLDVDVVLVRLIEDGRLVVRGSFYRSPEDAKEVERLLAEHPIRVGTGIAGRVAEAGQPLKSGDGSLEQLTLPGYVGYLSQRRWLVVPMKVKDRVIGVLTFITADAARDFSQRDLSLAQGIANEAAIAVENASLFEAAQQELAERRRAQEALRETRDYLENLLDYANAPIIVWDPSFTITRFNHAFERLTGCRSSDIVGKQLGILFPRDSYDETLKKIERTFSGERWEWVEIPILRSDGNVRTALWNSANIFGDDGRTVVATIAQGTDITEHKRVLGQLEQSQRMEVVGRLAGGVAHDFNNLLQALLSITEVLRLRGAGEARFGDALEELEAHIKRGAGLTRQLLLFARREASKPAPLDLSEVVQEASKMLRRLTREDICFLLEPSPEPLPVDADRGQLEQVLMNLVVNAAHAMPEGGDLLIRTGGDGKREVWLEVHDTGIGMTEEVQAKIFEPFFTTKERGEGSGLGLAVVHGIVTQHGGRIEVVSKAGEGSTFHIVLPRGTGDVPTPSSRMDDLADLVAGQSERVLLVEDEDGAREGLREMLTMLGYEVAAAGSAEQAVALPAEPAFELLLTDFLLPGMNGGELADASRARWPRLKVILMSGYSADLLATRGVGEGSTRFLQKPFDMATLARELRLALDEKDDPAKR